MRNGKSNLPQESSVVHRRFAEILLAAVLSVAAYVSPVQAEILFDQSPEGTGATFDGVWSSDSLGTENAEIVRGLQGAILHGVDYVSYVSAPDVSICCNVLVTIWEDANGLPGSVLFNYDVPVTSRSPATAINRSDLVRYYIEFPSTAITSDAFWLAISRGMYSLYPYVGVVGPIVGGDGMTALLSRSGGYSFLYPTGDLAFRLHGEPAPIVEPPSLAMIFGIGLLWLASTRLMRRGKGTLS